MLKLFTDKYGDDVYIEPSSVTALYTDYGVLDNPPMIVHGTTIMLGSERLFVKEAAGNVADELL